MVSAYSQKQVISKDQFIKKLQLNKSSEFIFINGWKFVNNFKKRQTLRPLSFEHLIGNEFYSHIKLGLQNLRTTSKFSTCSTNLFYLSNLVLSIMIHLDYTRNIDSFTGFCQQQMRGTFGICSVAVLQIFLSGFAVKKLQARGVAVILSVTVCNVCILKCTVYGETKLSVIFQFP